MAAFDGTNTFAKGDQVVVHGRTIGTVQAVGAHDYGNGLEPTGYYVVNGASFHHSELGPVDTFGDMCAACGMHLHSWDEKAEVVNKTTGARGVTHAECYLADTDCYDLA